MEVGRFDLSVQQRWLLSIGGGCPATTCTAQFRSDATDLDALRLALVAEIARYEVLRTRFVIPDGLTMHTQVVDDEPVLTWVEGAAPAPSDEDAACGVRAYVVSDGATTTLTLRTSAAIADVASLNQLCSEAIATAQGTDNIAEDEPLQYADFAGWQAEKGAETDAANLAAGAYWRANLRSPATLQAGIGEVVVNLSATERTSLEALMRVLDTEPQAMWLGLGALLYNRMSGSASFGAAMAVDGRQDTELIRAIGAYVLSLPVGFEHCDTITLREACQIAATGLQYAQVHALLPAAQPTIAELGVAYTSPDLDPSTGIACIDAREGMLPAAVRLHIFASPDCTRVTVTTMGADAVAIANAWVQALRGVLATLTRLELADVVAMPLGAVDIWTPEDRATTLLRGVASAVRESTVRESPVREMHVGASGSPHAEDQISLAHSVAQYARQTPSQIAVIGDERSYTYAELWDRAVTIAGALGNAGVGPNDVGPNDVVGILLERNAETVAAIVGTWIAGAAYLPLHVDHPNDRIALQLQCADARIVITSDGMEHRVPSGATVVSVDQLPAVTTPSAVSFVNAAQSDGLAYVIFTSGSTGVPKGVGVSHRNVMSYARAARERLLNNDPADSAPDTNAGARSFAMVTSFNTDLGNTSLALALLTGGTVQVVPSQIAVDPAAYVRWNTAHPCDVLKVTPSHLRALLTAGPGCLPGELLVVGGEALSWDLVRQVESLGSCEISNHYGPTETTIGALTRRVTRGERHANSATVPIGMPLGGYRAFVLDVYGAPQPDGVAGELCIGGAGVAVGYLGRNDFTAERFVEDPLGGRMYRTGDAVRRHPDGNIEFLGRIDGQVKIRGYRVEPGEIEVVLEEHPDVRQAAVVPNAEPSGELRLVGYVTIETIGLVATPAVIDAIREYLVERLPSHMVPSIIVPLGAMPLMANGKLDRSALPDPATLQLGDDDDYVAPRDDVESALCVIWAELLGLERVGVTDDFFAIGGHSLLAAQVIARILRDFGVHLALHTLFVAPNIEALSALVTEAQIAAAGGEEAFEAMLDELEGLSDEEVAALLGDGQPADGP